MNNRNYYFFLLFACFQTRAHLSFHRKFFATRRHHMTIKDNMRININIDPPSLCLLPQSTHMCTQGLDLYKVSVGDCWMLWQWGTKLLLKQALLHFRVVYLQPNGSNLKWNSGSDQSHWLFEACDSCGSCLRGPVRGNGWFWNLKSSFLIFVVACYRSRENSAAGRVIWYFCTAVTGGRRQQKVHWACRSQSPCWDHTWKSVTC